MDTEAKLTQLNRAIWTGIGAVAVIVLASSVFGPFRLDWASFARTAAVGVALAAGAWYYRTRRNEPQLAAALTSTSQIIAFALVGAPLSYIAASAGFPLWDATFVAWDRHLGFDWAALLHFMNEHPILHIAFAFSYASFPLQATAIIVALAWTRHVLRMRVFVLAFMLTTIITIAISAIMPAQGVWGHLHLSPTDHPAIAPITQSLHLPIFHGLRDGTWRLLTGAGSEGIITFPSLHAALGLLFIVAAWPVPYVRWAAASINVMMIVATPVDGGHYFADVIAGVAIAAACWRVTARFAADTRNAANGLTALSDAPSIAPHRDGAATRPAETPEYARERV
jgi:hypothetical protein